MSIRRVAVLAFTGVLVGVLAWSLAQTGGSDSASPGAGSTPAATGTLSPGTSATASSSGTSSGTESTGAGDASAPSTTGARGQISGHDGSEILPSPSSAASAGTGLPGLKQPSSTTAPLVAAPLPKQATGTGTLVAGYPTLLAPPARHTIAVSSVSPGGSVLQASLTASCARPCNPLLRYRVRLAARGFTETSVPSVENQPTAAYQRGDDSVTATITGRSATTIEYAVYAVLHTARA